MLRPLDIVVALRLSQIPNASYHLLSQSIGISRSQIHISLKRLAQSRLISAVKKEIQFRHLLEFLEHGLRYAFPGELGRASMGIPTAHAGPALASLIVSEEAIVWPTLKGNVEGVSLKPLYPQATTLPILCPPLYEVLTAVDALRVGRIRERQMALSYLRDALQPKYESASALIQPR